MATEELFLRYRPPWHQIGDADNPGFAILYGILAMTTVWVFEGFAQRVLFSSAEELDLSEFGAVVTFKGSYWHELLDWALRRKGPEKTTAVNRRAVLGIILRFVVIFADIVIIILAIPRSIEVFDRDVGSPQANFEDVGNKLLKTKDSSAAEFNPCIWDKLHFADFTPFAATLTCSTSAPFDNTAANNVSIGNVLSTQALLIVKYNSTLERLQFTSTQDNTTFFITHNLFIPESDERKAETLSLPLPKNISVQAVNALSADVEFNKLCTLPNTSLPKATSPTAFVCNSASITPSGKLARTVIVTLMEKMRTTRVDAVFSKRSPKGAVKEGFKPVGTINRPYLCVIPAIILLVGLGCLDLIARLVLMKDNMLLKLYNLAMEHLGMDTRIRPLYVPSKRIEADEENLQSE